MSDRKKGSGAKGKPPGGGGGRGGGASSGPPKSGGRLGGRNVGQVLRTAYDDSLREPVPDDFLNLLGQLD